MGDGQPARVKMAGQGLTVRTATDRVLTPAEFYRLTDVPPEVEWFGNLRNRHTRKAYANDIKEFMAFVGLREAQDFRTVTRAHVIAWRYRLEHNQCAGSTLRRKLAALSSLFNYLCEQNAVFINPVDGVTRPKANNYRGKSPVISDAQATALLAAPPADTLKGKRDRALLSTLAYHALRREEVCRLRVKDLQQIKGVLHFRVRGKGEKERDVPVATVTQRLLTEYLEAAGHKEDREGPLFRPVKNNMTGTLAKPLHPNSVYEKVVRRYAREVGITADVHGFCVHSLRATAATNALDNGADIAKVQEWMGHAHISTTRIYDHRQHKPEESPTFRVRY
jgi:integrase/recombinase XerD